MGKIKKIIFGLLVFLFFVLSTEGATVYTISGVSSTKPNEFVTVNLYVNSENSTINNAEGVLSFPTDLLSVTSVSTAGSIFNLWVEQPSYSNADGTISFNGGVPNPGYSGSNGKILTVTFKTKSAGIANLSFASAVVRANDGLGTNVLSGGIINKTSSQIAIVASEPITEPEIVPTTPVVEPSLGLPSAPKISVLEITNNSLWYSKNELNFSWPIAKDVTGTQLLFGKYPDSTPTVTYEYGLGSKNVKDIPDGVWYFHARLRNQNGWGKTTHYRVKIDNTAPSLDDIGLSEDGNDRIIKFVGEDETSGLARFEIYINDEKVHEIKKADIKEGLTTNYILPPLHLGQNNVKVVAVDEAGNQTQQTIQVEGTMLPAPEIITYPDSVTEGSSFKLKGTSALPNYDLQVVFELANGEIRKYVIRSDKNSEFEFNSQKIDFQDRVTVWVENFERQIPGASSDKINIQINKSVFEKLVNQATEMFSLIVPALTLILISVILVLIMWLSVRKVKKKISNDLSSAKRDINRAFNVLNADIKKHVVLLRKAARRRDLTAEEIKILTSLSKHIDQTEEYIEKKINKVKEDL